jgi:hypothetical protein
MPKPGLSATEFSWGYLICSASFTKKFYIFLTRSDRFLYLWPFVGNETGIVQHMFETAVCIIFAKNTKQISRNL